MLITKKKCNNQKNAISIKIELGQLGQTMKKIFFLILVYEFVTNC